MKGGNAQWYTPRRKRRLFFLGLAAGAAVGVVIGGALVCSLTHGPGLPRTWMQLALTI